ncbi:MAG: DUF3226 domain-containing protein [Promethearchaeota archaeon]
MSLKEKKPVIIEKKRLLLVEGIDEIKFFDAYLRYLDIDNIQVEEVKGKTKFKDELPLIVVNPGFPQLEKIGLIRDADDDFDATLNSVYDRLVQNSLVPIKKHNEFSTSKLPYIGIFIMPGLDTKGSIEDLCLKVINTSNKLDCTNDYIDCIKKSVKDLNQISKRKVQVYLASQKELCNSLGIGAQKKYWDFDSDIYDDIKKFIQDLSR